MKIGALLLFSSFLFIRSALAQEVNMEFKQLPSVVQSFVNSINNEDQKLFESLWSEAPVVDDWGKIITGRKDIFEFSSHHLVGAKANFEVTGITLNQQTYTLDGQWKSEKFSGPSRFIFKLEAEKIQTLIISSPRWFERLFIKIRSFF